MISKKFMMMFLFTFVVSGFCTFMVWRLFLIEQRLDDADSENEQDSCVYEDIDLVMPVAAFLKRGANSALNSYVRRLFVNQWISSNQSDLVRLIVYGQGSTNYAELKKALVDGIEKEGKSGAASFILGTIKRIDENPKLIEHVNKSLVEGYGSSIHSLRGQIMGAEQGSMEYRKLKKEYRKQLDQWVDENHGELLDEIIAKL